MKSLSILSSASRAIRPRHAMKYLIPSSRKVRVRVPRTIRQVAIYVHHRASRREVGGGAQYADGQKEERGGVSHPSSYAGLNDPRLIRHKRLILKNSSQDKSFPGEPRIPFALRPLAFQAVTELLSGAD